jgi:transcriptional regulator with XRE-family HTH domain
MTLKMIFIRNLKDFRKKEGLSQMKLAEFCNISFGYIGEIESGRKFPSTEMIEKISQVLKIEPYQLFKNPIDNFNGNKQLPSLSYNVKKKIKTNIKKEIKAQINSQINTQINLSMNKIFNEINEIIDKN